MTHNICILNRKGGCGKTTLAFNLAAGLARKKKRVLAIDTDSQANLTRSLVPRGTLPSAFSATLFEGRAERPHQIGDNLYIYAADGELIPFGADQDAAPRYRAVVSQIMDRAGVDYVIQDTGPHLNNITYGAIMSATHLLIPLEPAPFGLEGLGEVVTEFKKLRSVGATRAEILGIVFSLVDATRISNQIMDHLEQRYPEFVFKARLYRRTALKESPIKNQSIWDYERGERKASTEMDAVLSEVMKRLQEAR